MQDDAGKTPEMPRRELCHYGIRAPDGTEFFTLNLEGRQKLANHLNHLEGALREAEERWSHAVEGGAESIRKANERADGFWEERRLMSREITDLKAELREAEAKAASNHKHDFGRWECHPSAFLDYRKCKLCDFTEWVGCSSATNDEGHWDKYYTALQQPKAGD